jgi:hypothetical protein
VSCGCDSCGEREGLFAKLKARFGSHGCGCDGGCSSGGCAPSVAPPTPVAPPKKMPVKEGPPPSKVGFEAESSPLPAIPAATAPTIEIVAPPVASPAPGIANQPRSPF